jgi:hypothetical protein
LSMPRDTGSNAPRNRSKPLTRNPPVGVPETRPAVPRAGKPAA